MKIVKLLKIETISQILVLHTNKLYLIKQTIKDNYAKHPVQHSIIFSWKPEILLLHPLLNSPPEWRRRVLDESAHFGRGAAP